MEENVSSGEKKLGLPLIIVAVVVVIAVLVYVGWRQSTPQPAEVERAPLSDAERQAILDTLRRPENVPPLTDAERAAVERLLELPPETPPLTDDERAELLRALQSN